MPAITRKILTLLAGGALLTAAVAACSSDSKDTKAVASIPTLSGKSTSVALDTGFVNALTQLKLKPGLVGKASMQGTTVTFPITGGHVTVYKKGQVTPYVQGKINHSGSGLSLTGGSTKVTLQNFVVHPGNNSNLTGDVLVNGKSAAKGAKLFDLDGSTLKPITIDNGVATLTGTRVLMSSDAASLLDKTFHTSAVKGGLVVGVATILANAS